MRKGILLLFIFFKLSFVFAQTPALYFAFNNNYTTTGVNTTVMGIVPFVSDRCGSSTGAVSFTGVGNYVSFPGINVPGDFTLMSWVYNTTTSGDQKIFSNENGSKGFSFGIKAGKISLTVYDNASTFIQTPTTIVGTDVPLNSWSHIAASYSYSGGITTLNHYINGQLVYVMTMSSTTLGQNLGKGATIGQFNASAQYPFLGGIDDLKFYQSHLSDTEINAIYSTTTITTWAQACPGSNQSIIVNVSPTITGLSYQWYRGNASVIGSALGSMSDGGIYGGTFSNASLDITNIPATLVGSVFRSVVTGMCGAGIPTNFSNTATTTGVLVSLNTSTGILYPFADIPVDVCEGTSTSIVAITASGNNLAYVWLKDGATINNATDGGIYGVTFTTPGLVINNIPLSLSGSVFVASVSGLCGSVTSPGYSFTVDINSSITGQPMSANACIGDNNIGFNVSVTGTPTSFQWYLGAASTLGVALGPNTGGINYGSSISTAGLNIASVASTLVGTNYYRCLISDACGNVLTTSGASFFVAPPIGISPPGSLNVCPGSSTTLGINTTSGINLTFAWGMDIGSGFDPLSASSTVSGVNTRTLSFLNIPSGWSANYVCTVSGTCSTVVSSMGSLNTLTTTSAIDPIDQASCKNSTAIFTSLASGTGLSYHWLYSNGVGAFSPLNNNQTFTPISNSITGSVLSTSLSVHVGNNVSIDGYLFTLSVTGTCGSVTTTGATLNVQSGPSITTAPQPTTICSSGVGTISLAATGTALKYRWYKNTTVSSGLITSSTDGGIYSNFTTSGLTISNPPFDASASVSGANFICVIGSSCGSTTGSALLSVGSVTGIISQTGPLVSSCVGTNPTISVNATGTGLNFQWQSVSGGIGTNLSNGPLYLGVTSNVLTVLGISATGINYRVTITGQCGNTVSAVTTVQVNLGPQVDFFGLKSSYCDNVYAPDQLQAFTDLQYPQNTVSGTFVVAAGPGGILQSSSYNTININPGGYSYNGILIKYTSAPDQYGCSNSVTKGTNIYSTSTINPSFLSPAQNAPLLNTDAAVQLVALPTVNGTGVFTASEPAVLGSKFYPSYVPNIPSNSYKYVTLTYTFTQSVTGCKKSVNNNVYVYDNVNSYTFTTSATSGLINYYGTPAFCYQDDVNNYNLSFTGITPEVALGTTSTGICARSVLYTITGYNAINGTNTAMNSFVFNPSLLPYANYYSIGYYYDQTYATNTITCGGLRDPVLKQYTAYNQQILILDKPSPPYVNGITNLNYCQGNIPNISLTAYGWDYGDVFEWYANSTSSSPIITYSNSNQYYSSVLLSDLGITNTTTGNVYNFFVRFKSNSCNGYFTSFAITVNGIPANPTISATVTGVNTLLGKYVCIRESTPANLSAFSTTPGVTYSWFDGNHIPRGIQNTTVTGFSANVNSSIPATFTFYSSVSLNGCQSTQVGINIAVYPRPETGYPTITGGGGIVCINNIAPFDSVPRIVSQLISTSAVGFNWYLRSTLDRAISSSINYGNPGLLKWNEATTNTGSLYASSFTTTLLADNFQVQKQYNYNVRPFYTVSKCEAIDHFTAVSIDLYKQPAAPNVIQSDIYCNSPNYYTLSLRPIDYAGADYLNWYAKSDLTSQITSLSGNSLPLQNVMPPSRSNSYIDTNFYVTQVRNGCESTTTGIQFKMYPPFKKLVIGSSTFGIALPNATNTGCSGQTIGVASITGSFLPSTISGTWRVEWIDTTAAYGDISIDTTYLLRKYNVNTSLGILIRQSITQGAHVCYSDITTSGFTLNVKPTPLAPYNQFPYVTDTAFCMPGNVGSIVGMAFVGTLGGYSQSFHWYYSSAINSDGIYTGDGNSIAGTTMISTATGIYKSIFNSTLTGTNPPVVSTSPPYDKYTYYVSQNVNGCESSVTGINVLLYNTPDPPQVSPSYQICSGTPFTTLTGTSPSGNTIKWYLTGSFIPVSTVSGYYPNTSVVSNIHAWTDTLNSRKPNLIFATQTLNVPNNRYGCESAQATVTITVNAIPPAPIVNDSTNKYCLNDIILPLTALGVNGNLSDFRWYSNAVDTVAKVNGIAGTTYTTTESSFNAFSSYYFVSQIYNNCPSPVTTMNLVVRSLPVVSFTGLSNSYCEYSAFPIIKGIPTPISNTSSVLGSTFGVFTGANGSILINTLPGNAIFNPGLAVGTTNIIKYSFIDIHGCANSYQSSVKVNPRPTLSYTISPSITGSTICNYLDKDYDLRDNGTGTFSGSAVFYVSPGLYTFKPSSVSNLIGLDNITYHVVDVSTNCFKDSIIAIQINPTPNPKFSYDKSCATDIIAFKDISDFPTIAGTSFISSRKWRIQSDSSLLETYNYTFTSPETYEIRLEVVSDQGCVAEAVSNLVIGAYPKVDFTWKDICNGDSTHFINNSTLQAGGGNITVNLWNFDVNNQTSTLIGPAFKYDSIGKYNVSLKVTTDQNCVVTKSKEINTLSTIKSFPYIEDFDTDNGSWFVDGKNSSWIWSVENKSWSTTSISGHYAGNEKSALNFPCMDLSVLYKPMVKMDANYSISNGDGAVMQFSTDGEVWYPVGSIGTGLNWYAKSGIVGDPGDQQSYYSASTSALGVLKLPKQMGWTGNSYNPLTDSTVLSMRNVLDNAKDVAANSSVGKVRFRIAFASLQASTLPGFALNSIWLGERSRITLIENFANANSAQSNEAQTSTFDKYVDDLKDDAVVIQYHTSFPVSDEFNQFDPSDPGSRVLYYGVENIPKAALDGVLIPGLSTNLGLNLVYIDALADPKFHINLSAPVNNNTVEVTADFIALDTITGEKRELVGYIAIVENEITKNINGKAKFRNVLRGMIPSAAGTSYIGPWTVGSGKTVKQSWSFTSADVYDVNQLGAIAFIQDKKDNSILQAAYTGKNASVAPTPTLTFTGINDNSISNNDFIVFPNPASDQINLIFNSAVALDCNYQLYNQLGSVVYEGTIYKGAQGSVINITNLTSGVYFVKIRNSLRKIAIVR